MYATELADVAREAGLHVIEVDGWKTRGHGGLDDITGVVCHHTAGPSAASNPGDYPSLRTVRDGRTNLSGPLCNLGLGRAGTVYTVAAGLAYHAGAVRVAAPPYGNSHMLGIEAENDGVGEPWPSVQLDAYSRLCAALAVHYGFGLERVLAHKEVCYPPGRKTDPDFDMGPFRRRVEADMTQLRGPAHVPPPVVHHGYVLTRYLRAGLSGHDVAAWQRVVGAKDDGDFGPLTKARTREWQRGHHLGADGIVGPACCKAARWEWAGR
jgi:peptidoglycan hydrolase-like protein with peptidoglycan-binding domain